MSEKNPEVLIAGGGPVGLALALALKQGEVEPLVVDAREQGAAAADPRVLALSHGTRQILERLGVWSALKPTPITRIHISQRGGFGRTKLHRDDYGLPALGYVNDAGSLAAALDAACDRIGVQKLYRTRVDTVEVRADGVEVNLMGADGCRLMSAPLLANAEGRMDPGPGVVEYEYGQQAIITVVQPETPHGHLAWERFTPDGPLALLPFGTGYAVVFTAGPELAPEILALDDAAFLARLQAQFGRPMGFTAVEPRLAYPLLLRFRREPVAERQVWLGNAAQTLHPVAGQGFNLAARDVFHLADTLKKHSGPGFDAGSSDLLQRYADRRRLDRRGTIGFTDSLVRTFSNANPLLHHLRGAGLFLLDLVHPARDFVAKRMLYGGRGW